MIFKNAFGASDVEDDGDEELEGLEGEDGEDGATSRSVSKGKRKIPSNGVGLNPTDGQPGGFELVDKDGDSMRRKIRIEYITDKSRRHITFSKRKAGIMKKVSKIPSCVAWDSGLTLIRFRHMNCRL
jgi:pheromone receptor transcription factor